MLISKGTGYIDSLYVLDEIYTVGGPLLMTVIGNCVDKSIFYRNDVSEEFYPRRITDELFDRVIVKNLIGGKIVMARKALDPCRLEPLQMDTAILVPNSTLPGLIGSPKNIIGTALADLITLERISYGMPMPDGTYRIEVVESEGATKYKVVNVNTGFESDATAPAAAGVTTLIPGVSVKITALTGCVAGDYAEVDVFGDTTYIIPGTVLGRLNSGPNKGKYEVAIDPNIPKYDHVRIAAGALETDANKRKIASDGSALIVNADTLTVAVYVFAQLSKEVVQGVNMTEALEQMITGQGIVWY